MPDFVAPDFVVTDLVALDSVATDFVAPRFVALCISPTAVSGRAGLLKEIVLERPITRAACIGTLVEGLLACARITDS